MKFEEFSIDKKILQAIDDLGFTECLPVQEKTLAVSLDGRDVTVQSQTGSGKTAAFLITILQHKVEHPDSGKALVLAPTRELVIQIERDAKALGKQLNLSIASIIGGMGYRKQEDFLRSNPDIIIGTPGRLIDFMQQGKLKFEDLRILVIDEADRMFDMGFYPDIKRIMGKMPSRDKRQTMLFSATLNVKILNLAWQFMDEPEQIEIQPENKVVEGVSQTVYHVARNEKFKLLLGILERENPSNAVIFTNTKNAAAGISKRLNANGHSSEFIMGDLRQKKRIRIIDRMKRGELRFLVATDVAARGLHIEDLDMVVNYDLPEDPENYIHRIGRTARVGKEGKAITLACERYVLGLDAVEKLIGMKITSVTAHPDMYGVEKQGSQKQHREHRSRPGRPSAKGQRRPQGRDGHGKRSLHDGAHRSRSPAVKASKQQADQVQKKKKTGPPQAPSRKKSMEDRLAYYKQKYGEEFNVKKTEKASSPDNDQQGRQKAKKRKEKKGVVGTVKKLFGKPDS